MREKIIEMLDIVLANEGLMMEIDNDIHIGRVSISQYIGMGRFGVNSWETKFYSDTDPDCDGTLQQGIYYLKSITEKETA